MTLNDCSSSQTEQSLSSSMAHTAFFFGSGISFASGAPGVGAITNSLLQDRWIAHTDSRFYPRPADYEGDPRDADRAQEFLRRIKRQIEPHLQAREQRAAHYEDLFGALRQIVQDEMVEVSNPLIADTVAAIRAGTADLVTGQRAHIDDNAFASLADRASELIQWAVAFGLSRARVPRGLAVIGEIAKHVRDVDIFTLNHETLIEAQFDSDGVAYFDGFGEQQGDARIFDGSWPDSMAVRLFKLHGSLDWYRFRFPGWDQYARVTADVDHARDADGKLLNLLQPTPMFLTGTTVKEQAYGHGLVGELFVRFRERLSRHRTLICCGYGWSDKGINIRLDQWLRDARENRVVLLHPGTEREVTASRFWTFRWEQFRKAGKVVVVPKWLSDCTSADLAPFVTP